MEILNETSASVFPSESNYINDVNSEVWEYNISTPEVFFGFFFFSQKRSCRFNETDSHSLRSESGQFRQCTPTEFHSRTEHAALAYKGKVIIIGGYAGALGYTSTLLQFDPGVHSTLRLVLTPRPDAFYAISRHI
jgi:hypothetical protein